MGFSNFTQTTVVERDYFEDPQAMQAIEKAVDDFNTLGGKKLRKSKNYEMSAEKILTAELGITISRIGKNAARDGSGYKIRFNVVDEGE